VKFGCKLSLVLLTLVLATSSAFGNNYPYPGKRTEVPCTGCPDDNKDLPTYAYNDPIVAHVGRFVDSSRTINAQHIGMRTIRARAIRSNLNTDRVYLALGETVGSYNMDTFFTTVLKAQMSPASTLQTGDPYGRYSTPIERIAIPDSFLYPEAKKSGWRTEWLDHQVNLTDFDSDDRGNVYVGNLYWGWGISKDTGLTNGTHMTFVSQTDAGIEPNAVISIKSGNRYYAIIATAANSNSAKQIVYDTTNPASPVKGVTRTGKHWGVSSWTKNDELERIAIISPDGVLRIYSYSSLVSGTPIAEFSPQGSAKYLDAAIDETGRIWVAETNSNVLVRISPNGSGYTRTTHSVYGGPFAPLKIAAAGGYVAIAGKTDANEVRLIKLEGSNPVPVDTNNFFRKYYFAPPLGYAGPTLFVPAYTSFSDIGLVEHGNKTYLIFSAEGLGDVYEIEAGEAISASMIPNSFGTTNPNAPKPVDGPFYGDLLKFKATSNSTTATYTVDWNFGNPEAPTNIRQTDLGAQIEHQYSGLTTAAKISAPKTVTAKATSDASIASDLTVNLKVPVARVGIPGRAQGMTTATKEAFVVVAGEKFTDASDGAVEGHYSSWAIDSLPAVKIKPNGEIPVGALGSHTLTMTANYGMYDETTLTGSNPYTVLVDQLTYTVRPFTATIKPPANSANNLTFTADARATPDRLLLNTSQWTVTWTLVGGSAAAAEAAGFEPTAAETVNVGTVPPFVVPKGLIVNGSKVKLQITVPAAAVTLPAYVSVEDETTLVIPDPAVSKTGCGNAGDPCTLTAKSAASPSASTSSWSLSWSIKLGSNTVKTGTDNPITFTPATAGAYTATVTDTVFGKTGKLDFTVAAATCGPIAESHQANPATDCGNNCQANVDIEFTPNFFGYAVQPCDQFTWDFGDNTKATTEVAKHKYTANGTYPVKFTLKNNTGSHTWPTLSVKIGGGVVTPPTCVAPTAITFDWLGTKGCSPSKACEVGESVKFTGRRGASALANCDTTQWNINGTQTATKSPSFTFTSTGTFTVSLTVSNGEGTAPAVSKSVNVVPSTASCTGSAPEQAVSIEYEGAVSGCIGGGTVLCQATETIQFNPTFFGYSPQPCDRYEWDFGDGTPKSSAQSPTHAYADAVNRTATLRVYNTNNPTGVTKTADVLFSTAPIKQQPVLAFSNPPSSGSKGVQMTFTVDSDISTTGWVWNFGDGTGNDTSQSTRVARNSTITHTFNKTGPVSVQVSARNAEETNLSRVGIAVLTLDITETPEYRYLLPVVTHGPGQNNSVWRTDVQIYNPDPTVSDNNQLELTATFNGAPTTLRVAQSTYIFEDFMQRLTTASSASGPVILSTRSKYAPQIWTRTYNQTENGTFGQFIPAIRLDAAGGGSAIGTGKYFLAGLRNDASYRTNLGFVNPNDQAITVHVAVYDDQGLSLGQFDRTLQPFVLDQFPITHASALPNLKADRPFSLEMTVPDGKWMISYASSINSASNDPVYLQAIRESELSSVDYRDSFIPGVGHVGAWRSDVTVFNPYNRVVTVDLSYYDQSGALKGEANNVPVPAGAFLQYNDFLKQGVFGNLADSLGVLRVSVPSTVAADHFPMTFARTYNDDGSGKTYGQGIGGFAASRANVKPGKPALIPAVRNVPGKYYTNVGLTNVSNTDAVVTVKVLNPNTGAEIAAQQHTVKAFQSLVYRLDIGAFENASIKVEVTGGNIWAFCSMIDDRTKDPEYISAQPVVQ